MLPEEAFDYYDEVERCDAVVKIKKYNLENERCKNAWIYLTTHGNKYCEEHKDWDGAYNGEHGKA